MGMYTEIVKKCAAKEGASNSDVDEVFEMKPPSTSAGKCLHACIGTTTGAVSHYNKIQKQYNFSINCQINMKNYCN